MAPVMQRVQSSSHWHYVAAANEGDAVAIAAGAELGGVRSAVLMQNSGLGNAVNPLTSLAHTYRIPLLLLVSLRGDPEAEPDAPQHQLMGRITIPILESMEIPWEYLPSKTLSVSEALSRADRHLKKERRPFALVIRKGAFNDGCSLEAGPARRKTPVHSRALPSALHSRPEFLQALVQSTESGEVLLATTGYTGRELNDCADRENHFYMAGSMGCAASLGLGLALAKPQKRIFVLDGDAALTMRMGSLTAIGSQHPSNLLHIVFDNGVNESTGGQASPAQGLDFASIALACGYRRALVVNTPEQLCQALDLEGPTLVQVPVLTAPQGASPRPSLGLDQVAQRLRRFLS